MRNSLLISIFLLISWKAAGQSPWRLQKTADSLMIAGRYAAASLEYTRLDFFTRTHLSSNDANHAWCKLQMEDYQNAKLLANKAFSRKDTFGVRARIVYLQACYLTKAWDSMIRHASDFMGTDLPNSRRYRFYLMLAQLESGKLNVAVENALLLADQNGSTAIKKAWKKYKRRHKSPGVANVLSTLVPGLGQLYAHDAANAAKSILLHAAVALLVYSQWDDSKFVSGYLFLALAPRYYAGGIKNAGKSARFRNNELFENLRSTILAHVKLQ